MENRKQGVYLILRLTCEFLKEVEGLPLAIKFVYFFGALAAKSATSSAFSGIKASNAKLVVSLPIPMGTGLSLSSDISGADNREL